MTRSAARGPQKNIPRALRRSREIERLGNEASNPYKSFRTMLLTGSWFHLVSDYTACDDLRRTGGFFLLLFFPLLEHPAALRLPPEPGTEEAESFSSIFRASCSHLNSFVKLSLASSQPVFRCA